MMNAIAYGHKEVIKVFFNFDFSVDTVAKQGKMLLEWAIENGHLSLIEVIIINLYVSLRTVVHNARIDMKTKFKPAIGMGLLS